MLIKKPIIYTSIPEAKNENIKPPELISGNETCQKYIIKARGKKILKPIKYTEDLGSAQCKSAVMIAALKAEGKTKLKCLPSRNHTELMFKNVLKIPIKINNKQNYDHIEVNGNNEFKKYQ